MADRGEDAEQARAALASVEAMQRAAVERALPPRWFGAVMAAWLFLLFATQALERPWSGISFAVLMVGFAVGVAAKRRSMRAWLRPRTSARGLVLAAGLALLLPMALAAFVGPEELGAPWWLPLPISIAAAGLLYALYELQRRLALVSASG